ncbi:hypothetical protein CPB83DRAFT_896723 [Crepidotus variabilis]|uniref:Uncharacterized protein n=1 Tax=Crepidotus variabilis TaxID=179855 RepID=A0A9P6EAL3_9AGAR|nr:hypothetical protein CPB83DRAFT_896723 [Crepidotus variabilis]
MYPLPLNKGKYREPVDTADLSEGEEIQSLLSELSSLDTTPPAPEPPVFSSQQTSPTGYHPLTEPSSPIQQPPIKPQPFTPVSSPHPTSNKGPIILPQPLVPLPPPIFYQQNMAQQPLPFRGTKNAPQTFDGSYNRVERFLDHCDKLFTQHNIRDDQDKINALIEYCSTNVIDYVRTLDDFQIPDWDQLREALLTG